MVLPVNPDTILRQVADALRQSDLDTAARLSDAAVGEGLKHPIFFHARGVWLAARRRHEEALIELGKADMLPPPNLATKDAIVKSLAALGRYDEALLVCDAAIALKPDLAAQYVRKAWLHERNEQLLPARRALEQAVALQPAHPEANARLAFLASRRADWTAVRRYGEVALGSDPRQTAAQLALALADLEAGDLEMAETRLKPLAEGDAAGLTDRYLACNALGDVFDRRNQVEQAFVWYGRAKQLVREDPQRPVYSPAMRDVAMGLLRAFESRAPAASRADVPPAPHIFVTGFLRSGTTLVQQILASRDDTVALHEKDTFAEATRAYLAKPQDIGRLWAADDAELARQRDAYWQLVRDFGVSPEGKVVVDGTPINTVKIPLIAALFPGATIVFVVRDPRDVVLSCYRRSFAENPTTSELLTLEGAAQFYDTVMALAAQYRAKLPLKLYQIRLEDLIADFDGETRRLCAAAGVPWLETMRNFATKAQEGAIATPSGAQLARGLNADGVGQWRRYRRQLEPVLSILNARAVQLGYPAD